MSATRAQAPSAWEIGDVLQIVHQHLATLQPLDAPEGEPSNYPAEDAAALMDALKEGGADLSRLMERLLLAADEARAEVAMIRFRKSELARREDRREAFKDACRAAALQVMQNFPQLFPAGPRSKALLGFHSAVVDARVQQGREGVVVTIPTEDLEDRFKRVTVEPNIEALKEAVLRDGEVIDGVEPTRSAAYLVVKVA